MYNFFKNTRKNFNLNIFGYLLLFLAFSFQNLKAFNFTVSPGNNMPVPCSGDAIESITIDGLAPAVIGTVNASPLGVGVDVNTYGLIVIVGVLYGPVGGGQGIGITTSGASAILVSAQNYPTVDCPTPGYYWEVGTGSTTVVPMIETGRSPYFTINREPRFNVCGFGDLTSIPPDIGNNLYVCEGQSVAFEGEASGYLNSYRWQRNGTDLFGQSATTLSFTAAPPDDGAQFRLKAFQVTSRDVKNCGGDAFSRAVTLNVVATPYVANATTSSANICSGGNVTLNADLERILGNSGPQRIQYQWVRRPAGIAQWCDVPGNEVGIGAQQQLPLNGVNQSLVPVVDNTTGLTPGIYNYFLTIKYPNGALSKGNCTNGDIAGPLQVRVNAPSQTVVNSQDLTPNRMCLGTSYPLVNSILVSGGPDVYYEWRYSVSTCGAAPAASTATGGTLIATLGPRCPGVLEPVNFTPTDPGVYRIWLSAVDRSGVCTPAAVLPTLPVAWTDLIDVVAPPTVTSGSATPSEVCVGTLIGLTATLPRFVGNDQGGITSNQIRLQWYRVPSRGLLNCLPFGSKVNIGAPFIPACNAGTFTTTAINDNTAGLAPGYYDYYLEAMMPDGLLAPCVNGNIYGPITAKVNDVTKVDLEASTAVPRDVCAGDQIKLDFNVAVHGGPDVVYQWFRHDPPTPCGVAPIHAIPGTLGTAIGPQLGPLCSGPVATVTTNLPTTPGTYQFWVDAISNTPGCLLTQVNKLGPINVTVNNPSSTLATITTVSPLNVCLNDGSAAADVALSGSVTTSGGPGTLYQWYRVKATDCIIAPPNRTTRTPLTGTAVGPQFGPSCITPIVVNYTDQATAGKYYYYLDAFVSGNTVCRPFQVNDNPVIVNVRGFNSLQIHAQVPRFVCVGQSLNMNVDLDVSSFEIADPNNAVRIEWFESPVNVALLPPLNTNSVVNDPIICGGLPQPPAFGTPVAYTRFGVQDIFCPGFKGIITPPKLVPTVPGMYNYYFRLSFLSGGVQDPTCVSVCRFAGTIVVNTAPVINQLLPPITIVCPNQAIVLPIKIEGEKGEVAAIDAPPAAAPPVTLDDDPLNYQWYRNGLPVNPPAIFTTSTLAPTNSTRYQYTSGFIPNIDHGGQIMPVATATATTPTVVTGPFEMTFTTPIVPPAGIPGVIMDGDIIEIVAYNRCGATKTSTRIRIFNATISSPVPKVNICVGQTAQITSTLTMGGLTATSIPISYQWYRIPAKPNGEKGDLRPVVCQLPAPPGSPLSQELATTIVGAGTAFSGNLAVGTPLPHDFTYTTPPSAICGGTTANNNDCYFLVINTGFCRIPDISGLPFAVGPPVLPATCATIQTTINTLAPVCINVGTTPRLSVQPQNQTVCSQEEILQTIAPVTTDIPGFPAIATGPTSSSTASLVGGYSATFRARVDLTPYDLTRLAPTLVPAGTRNTQQTCPNNINPAGGFNNTGGLDVNGTNISIEWFKQSSTGSPVSVWKGVLNTSGSGAVTATGNSSLIQLSAGVGTHGNYIAVVTANPLTAQASIGTAGLSAADLINVNNTLGHIELRVPPTVLQPEQIPNSVDPTDGDLYYMVVTNSCGVTVSDKAKLTVNQPIRLVTPPANRTVCEQQSAQFCVTATGSGLKYQWYRGLPPSPLSQLTGPTLAPNSPQILNLIKSGDRKSVA